jgi:hypothetical protein
LKDKCDSSSITVSDVQNQTYDILSNLTTTLLSNVFNLSVPDICPPIFTSLYDISSGNESEPDIEVF